MNVAVQIVTAGAILRTDYHQAFSGAMEAARFIRDHHLHDRPVVANPDDPVTPVAVLLDRPFFFPITGETTEATLFHSRRASVSQAQLLEHARRLAATANGEALLVLDYELDSTPTPGVLTKLIYRSCNAERRVLSHLRCEASMSGTDALRILSAARISGRTACG